MYGFGKFFMKVLFFYKDRCFPLQVLAFRGAGGEPPKEGSVPVGTEPGSHYSR